MVMECQVWYTCSRDIRSVGAIAPLGHRTGGRLFVDAKRVLTAKESADYLRISTFTLRKIEKEGLIVPYRTPGGHRRYSMEMLNEYLEASRIPPDRRDVVAA
jgi:excisionase family DNA binding protein